MPKKTEKKTEKKPRSRKSESKNKSDTTKDASLPSPPSLPPIKNPSSIWIGSFDIGKKNFAFCIEEIDRERLVQIQDVPSIARYNSDGTPTERMTALLNDVCMNGKIVLHHNVDITENCDAKKTLDPETFHNMTDVLDRYSAYWDLCSLFVIEEQMAFGKKLNKMAVKLGQHCYSYFAFRYSRFKTVIEFPAYYKTQVLGAPKVTGKVSKNGKQRFKAMDKPQRKKWSVAKAEEILVARNEFQVLAGLTSAKKKDDLADTLTQLQAAKYKIFVEKKVA